MLSVTKKRRNIRVNLGWRAVSRQHLSWIYMQKKKTPLAAVEHEKVDRISESLFFVCFTRGDSATFWLMWKSLKIDDATRTILQTAYEEEEKAEMSCLCLRVHVVLIWECEPKLTVEYLLAGVLECRTICSCNCSRGRENKPKQLLMKIPSRVPRKGNIVCNIFFNWGFFPP